MSNVRDVRRARKHSEECEAEVRRLRGELDASERKRLALESDLRLARSQVEYERLQRVAAQRGLVRYMREAGLTDRIGYDPDKDPQVLSAIARGEIPKPGLDLAVLVS